MVTEPHPTRKDTWYLRAWDLAVGRGGARPLLAGGAGGHAARQKVTMDFGADFDFAPVMVLVSSGVALLSFTGRGSDTPQELVAFEIPDIQRGGKFRQLWRDSIHEWGHFQLPNLFAGDVYKFNLLTNRIEVFNIRTFRKIHSIPLVEEMRYPRGDVSGDGRHLAIPGKLSHDNSPAISVWTLASSSGSPSSRLSNNEAAISQRFLVPNQAICPFRYDATINLSYEMLH